MASLEENLKEAGKESRLLATEGIKEKPDWKELVPFWGLYQIYKDEKAGKPTMIDDEESWQYAGMTVYHWAATSTGLIGLVYLADKYIF